MASIDEFDHRPVPPQHLQPARYFAASYAGEHIAGTEFVIGAAFVTWGASAADVLIGLLVGNLIAVLTWVAICAPIAVDTRLTLYAHLERVAGQHFVRIYSVVNGILFSVLAGAMITVSASAVRIPFGIAPQTRWFPTDPLFVSVAVVVGAVVVTVAALGFRRMAQFAEVAVPWMAAMFLVGALAMLPFLARQAGLELPVSSIGDLWLIADTMIWVAAPGGSGLTVWHVAAFAWVANLAMHGSLGDMALLRYAKRTEYGYFSALGMFIGHFAAWIFAGVMGAGAAAVMRRAITDLDAGEVAFQALGTVGIIVVILAGWTTSNPTLYRAGLAFQSLNPNWSRVKVTVTVGAVTTAIACFPFVFTRLLDFVGVMGLMLAPVGAILIAEHWLFPKLGLTRYWARYAGKSLNLPALTSWAVGLAAAYILNRMGLHLFFLLTPVWVITSVVYILLAQAAGAGGDFREIAAREQDEAQNRRAIERDYLQAPAEAGRAPGYTGFNLLIWIATFVAGLSLLACLSLGVYVAGLGGGELEEGFHWFRQAILFPTATFFLAAITIAVLRET